SVTIGYDNRDSWRSPRRGWKNELELIRTVGDGSFWTMNLDLRRYVPTWRRQHHPRLSARGPRAHAEREEPATDHRRVQHQAPRRGAPRHLQVVLQRGARAGALRRCRDRLERQRGLRLETLPWGRGCGPAPSRSRHGTSAVRPG